MEFRRYDRNLDAIRPGRGATRPMPGLRALTPMAPEWLPVPFGMGGPCARIPIVPRSGPPLLPSKSGDVYAPMPMPVPGDRETSHSPQSGGNTPQSASRRRSAFASFSKAPAASQAAGQEALSSSSESPRQRGSETEGTQSPWSRFEQTSKANRQQMQSVFPENAPRACFEVQAEDSSHELSDGQGTDTDQASEREQRLVREKREMLEAARRRDAEDRARRAQKDAWQVEALAQRRREAAEKRRQEAEAQSREKEEQKQREELEERRRRQRAAAAAAHKNSLEGVPASASDLHGDVLQYVLSFLDARSLLLSAIGVRQLWNDAARDDALWFRLCQQHWATKASRFHLTPEREAKLKSDPYGPKSWLDAYREAELDGSREFILREELMSLKFAFRWRQWARQVAAGDFRFCEDNLTEGHPFSQRFAWVLDDLGVGIQWGPPHDMFPKGFVSRLPDWSWRIETVNVILTEVDSRLDGDSQMASADLRQVVPRPLPVVPGMQSRIQERAGGAPGAGPTGDAAATGPALREEPPRQEIRVGFRQRTLSPPEGGEDVQTATDSAASGSAGSTGASPNSPQAAQPAQGLAPYEVELPAIDFLPPNSYSVSEWAALGRAMGDGSGPLPTSPSWPLAG
mmetsp:Transcript_3217/g.5816  ORF Transcript_3217/g.5816 Transcript_3217/m.5816 type:complete len:630 (-) Transcript_3217:59-1948(-)